MNLLSLGYLIIFLCPVLLSSKKVHLYYCKIDDYGAKNLMKYIMNGKDCVAWKYISHWFR